MKRHPVAPTPKGFTLIEILIVIGIIAILAAIVIIAINPAKQFAQARNTQRESNVSTILNAIGQNMADNRGILKCDGVAIDANPHNIGTTPGLIDLKSCLVPEYIPTALPVDPDNGTQEDTLYTLQVAAGRYTVCAPNHQEDAIASSSAYCLTR